MYSIEDVNRRWFWDSSNFPGEVVKKSGAEPKLETFTQSPLSLIINSTNTSSFFHPYDTEFLFSNCYFVRLSTSLSSRYIIFPWEWVETRKRGRFLWECESEFFEYTVFISSSDSRSSRCFRSNQNEHADFRVFNIEVSISSFYGGSLTNDLELEGKSLSDSVFDKYSHLIYRQIKDVFHNFQLNKYVDIYLCVGNFGGFY